MIDCGDHDIFRIRPFVSGAMTNLDSYSNLDVLVEYMS